MKKKQTVQEVDALDYNVNIRINVSGENIPYAPFAFPKLINWKHNIFGPDLEKTKKEFSPKLGSTILDQVGNEYRFEDISLSTEPNPLKDTPERPLYIITLIKI